jgi:hypothetical protein
VPFSFSPEEGSRSNFQNVVFLKVLDDGQGPKCQPKGNGTPRKVATTTSNIFCQTELNVLRNATPKQEGKPVFSQLCRSVGFSFSDMLLWFMHFLGDMKV